MLTGQTLGPYRVLEKIGEGGMGQVFRARDAKLNRDVALKVLPDSFANDADRLARFTREAQTLASLNHPNIAAIYGLEESGGEEESGSDPNKHVGVRPRTTALVMELVEGEDLSQLIARLRAPGASAGQAGMPLDEALPIAKQIAEALEAAHEQGIIHRDLKPANIKVRADGVVKVLDFGLAKALAPAGSRDPAYENLTQSPTLTTPAHLRQGYGAAGTEAGMILGTAAYMSPEQARGKPVDKRTDIWAFGAVLYEMLAGVRPFDGEDATEMIAAVVKTTPDWSALPADVPRPIVALIQRCLEKDRKARVGDIAVARFLLADIAALESSTGAKSQGFEPKAQSPKPVAPWRQMLPWAVTAAALAAAVTVQAPWRVDTPVDRPLVRLDVDLGADVSLPTTVSENGNGGNSLTISPDGTRLVYVSGDGTQRRLFTRRLDQEKATELPGTDGGAHPFFSPDGQWIGFFSRGTVRKISVEGGAVVRLLANITSTAGGGSWADDGSIIASDSTGKGLLRIPDGGGPAETIAPRGDGDFALVLPTMLPGGKAILFVSAYGTDVDRNAIEVLTLADRRRKIVARGHSPRYLASSPGAGYLVYNNRTTLFAIPFDLETLETRGTAVPVLDDVANDFSTGAAHFGVTGTGTLVYRRAVGGTSALTTVQWVDSAGKQAPLMAKPGGYQDLRLSPDGTQVAVTVRDVVGQDVWVYDLRRDTLTRLTFGGAVNSFPTWSPDGLNIVFSRLPGGLFQARADGASPPTPLTQVNINTQQFPWSFAPDGKRLAYTEAVASGQLWTLPLEAQRGQLNAGTPEPFLKSSFSDGTPAFSPDGRWLAYRSSESGTNEVYVRGFPPPSSGAGGKWPISNGGGLQPHWSPNGRELLYRSGDQVMAVGYTAAGDTFVAEKPRVWIPKLGVAAGASANTAVWDLAPDGKRVAVITPVESASTPTQEHEVVFLQNFVDELRRRVPLGK